MELHVEVSGTTRFIMSVSYYDAVSSLQFHSEAERLNSFKDWKSPFVTPVELAKAGFYLYKGVAPDNVRCDFCGIEIYNWVENDIPMNDHRKHSPACRFVRNLPCGNIPIESDMEETLQENTTPHGDDSTVEESYSSTPSSGGFNIRERTNQSEPESELEIVNPNITKEEVEDGNLCKVCYSNAFSILFLPCKHLLACKVCADKLEICGVCRQKINSKINVFIP